MEDTISVVANAGDVAQRSKKNDRIKKLRKQLGKKEDVLTELDVLEMKLLAQKKCLTKIKKIVATVSDNIKEIQKKIPENETETEEPEMKKMRKEVNSCSQVTKALKSYLSKEKALNNIKLNETEVTKKNVNTFVNEIVSSYNSLLRGTSQSIDMSADADGSDNESNTNKISHALFDLYESTKNKSLQDLIKESKKKNNANVDNNKKRKRKKGAQ